MVRDNDTVQYSGAGQETPYEIVVQDNGTSMIMVPGTVCYIGSTTQWYKRMVRENGNKVMVQDHA